MTDDFHSGWWKIRHGNPNLTQCESAAVGLSVLLGALLIVMLLVGAVAALV